MLTLLCSFLPIAVFTSPASFTCFASVFNLSFSSLLPFFTLNFAFHRNTCTTPTKKLRRDSFIFVLPLYFSFPSLSPSFLVTPRSSSYQEVINLYYVLRTAYSVRHVHMYSAATLLLFLLSSIPLRHMYVSMTGQKAKGREKRVEGRRTRRKG
mmetsp:Transcript_26607/g.68300  ORF Transcript_26607/g.68300 Transcript_26607/m.68300 type:complete len:153 (-) Transcript_26607:27-485(-)